MSHMLSCRLGMESVEGIGGEGGCWVCVGGLAGLGWGGLGCEPRRACHACSGCSHLEQLRDLLAPRFAGGLHPGAFCIADPDGQRWTSSAGPHIRRAVSGLRRTNGQSLSSPTVPAPEPASRQTALAR